MARASGGLYLYGASGITVPTSMQGTTGGGYSILYDATNLVQYWGQTAGGVLAANFTCDNSNLARPYITFPAQPGQGNALLTSNEFQEAFGTTPASAGAAGPGNPFSGVAAGSPATAGSIVASQFGTAPVPWGFALLDVFAVYSVSTAALTAATLGVNRLIYTEATAISSTAVLAPTTIALTTTTNATTVHVQRVPIAQPQVYEMADYSTLSIILSLTSAATSIVRLYGIGMHVAFCYA